jgi:hypothetical protein
MMKKTVLSALLLAAVLLTVSACTSATIEVGVEPPAEENTIETLPTESIEDQTAGLLPASEEGDADDLPAEDVSAADAPVDGVVFNDDGSSTYTNIEYGFRFSFPAGWSLTETPYEEMPEESGFDRGPSIQLTNSDILLFIGYRHAGEQAIWWTGVGAFGPEISRDTIVFLGQDVMQVAHGSDGQVKFVAFESADGGPISAGDLEFGIRMDDMSQAPFEELEIPQNTIDDAAAILTSFELLP